MGGRMHAVALVLALTLSMGCAALETASAPSSWWADAPTLLVENRSAEQVAVYLGGMRIGTATGGRNCIRLPQTLGEVRLAFAATAGPEHAGRVAHLDESRHWRVELRPGGTLRYDVLDVVPAKESCLGEG